MTDPVRFGALTLEADASHVKLTTKGMPLGTTETWNRNEVEGLGLRIDSDGERGRRYEIGLILRGGEWRRLSFFREEEPGQVERIIQAWGEQLALPIFNG